MSSWKGGVKLSINSAQGKTLLLGFFGPGTILGLAAAILGRTHAATAEILEPTKVIFVSCKELLREIQGDVTVASPSSGISERGLLFHSG